MKRQWGIEELIEHFTLVEDDLEFLANKTGPTRLGFALLLKCFQYEGRFLLSPSTTFPGLWWTMLRTNSNSMLPCMPSMTGGTHRERPSDTDLEHLAFREATTLDTEDMTSWLVTHILAGDQNLEHLKVVVTTRFRERKIEPPTTERLERLICSGCHTYEQQLFAETMQRLPEFTGILLDDLLARSVAVAEEEEQIQDDEPPPATAETQRTPVTWQDLKTSPGAVGLESVLHEIDKLRVLLQLALPADLFEQVSPKVVTLYRERAATETLYELRRHPDATRDTLLAAFCQQRMGEVTDSLVDLLLLVIRRIGAKAEKHVKKQYRTDCNRSRGSSGGCPARSPKPRWQAQRRPFGQAFFPS